MSPDHPNARRLAGYYAAMARAMDAAASDADRQVAFMEIVEQMGELFAPDFVIHTAGVRLAASGDREFAAAMGRRRNELSGHTFRPVGTPAVVADDQYAVVRTTVHAQRDGMTLSENGMGVWRFAGDRATEHWEISDGLRFDKFFIGGDPDFEFSTGEEFWLKDSANGAAR